MAGLGAGVAVSFLACPTELMKCRLQAQASVEGKPEVLMPSYWMSGPLQRTATSACTCKPVQSTVSISLGSIQG